MILHVTFRCQNLVEFYKDFVSGVSLYYATLNKCKLPRYHKHIRSTVVSKHSILQWPDYTLSHVFEFVV